MSDRDAASAKAPEPGAVVPLRPAPSSSVVASEWNRRDWLMRRVLAIADAVALLGSVALTLLIIEVGRSDGLDLLLVAVAYLPVWILLFKVYGLYERDIRRISHAVLDEVPWVVHAVLIGALGFWFAVKLSPVDQVTLSEGAFLVSAAAVLVLLLRAWVRRLMIAALGPERLLVVGVNGIAPSVAAKLVRHPEYGVRPVGALTPDESVQLGGLARLGAPADFARAVAELGIERALICREGLSGDEVSWLVDEGRRLGVKVGIVPDTVEALGYSVEIDEVEGVTILAVNPPVLSRTSRYLKRAFDLGTVALVAVPALLLGILIAIAVKLGSRGPVFYRQPRVGRKGRTFQLVKFRTMVVDADERRSELMAQSQDPNWLHLREDPRINPVGRVLRHFSLDELPQLIHVATGRMSMVGPRPLIPEESGQIEGWALARQDLTPGVTGLWQVLGRTEIPFEEMVKLDYIYVTNWSLWLDVKILLRTIPAVLARRGVN